MIGTSCCDPITTWRAADNYCAKVNRLVRSHNCTNEDGRACPLIVAGINLRSGLGLDLETDDSASDRPATLCAMGNIYLIENRRSMSSATFKIDQYLLGACGLRCRKKQLDDEG